MPDDIDSRKLALEEKRFEFDSETKRRELDLREQEAARQREVDARSRKFQFTPTATAIIAGILSLTTGGLTAFLGGFWSLKAQQDRNQAELALKEKERQFQIVIRATENRTPEEAAKNLLFFVDIKYLPDPDGSIRRKAESKDAPIITSPAAGIVNPLMDRHANVSARTESSRESGSNATYRIVDHLLVDAAGKPVSAIPAHSLAAGLSPRVIVFHFTASGSSEGVAKFMESPESRGSAHILIDRNGAVIQTVPFDYIAHHVGGAKYKGLSPLNKYSIGIEMVNWGDLKRVGDQWVSWANKPVPEEEVFKELGKETGNVAWHNFTVEQIHTATEISKALISAYPAITEIVGHETVSPERRKDPGPAFPIDKLRDLVLAKKP